jgi:uncharacterized protein YggU (UPF0235/DUF167 family)
MKISVSVHLKSKKPRIEKNNSGILNVYVNHPATDNKANKAVVEALVKYFQVKKSAVRLISGAKYKKKTYEIRTK